MGGAGGPVASRGSQGEVAVRAEMDATNVQPLGWTELRPDLARARAETARTAGNSRHEPLARWQE
eukprot:12817472-Alexandrium_andersonii.AAC.1